ncbi:hypothetical protein SAMN03159444_02197, partial [Pseudomonas sp. NFACC02]
GPNTSACITPEPVGAVRGYEGRECDMSVTVDVADPAHSPAGSSQVCELNTGACINPDSVGAVRGYEGMGRNSDEGGMSVTVDVTDPPHSPASRLLHRSEGRTQVHASTRNLWETSEVTRAANALCQSLWMSLTRRIRQQAPLVSTLPPTENSDALFKLLNPIQISRPVALHRRAARRRCPVLAQGGRSTVIKPCHSLTLGAPHSPVLPVLQRSSHELRPVTKHPNHNQASA